MFSLAILVNTAVNILYFYLLAWAELAPEDCSRYCQYPTLTDHTYHVRLLNVSTCGSLPPFCMGGAG